MPKSVLRRRLLASASTDLRDNKTLATAGSLYQFSVQGRNVSHYFEPIEGNRRTQGRLQILTSIEAEKRKSLAGDADEIWQIMPVEKRDKSRRKHEVPPYVDEQGWMLAAQRFSTTSSPTASQYSAEPALGTAYIAVRSDTPDEGKALNLLWNSTPVLIQLLSMRSKKAAYIHWSATQLQSVKLPASAREPLLVRTLAAVHDELADMAVRSRRSRPRHHRRRNGRAVRTQPENRCSVADVAQRGAIHAQRVADRRLSSVQ